MVRNSSEMVWIILFQFVLRRVHQVWRKLALRESRARQAHQGADTSMEKPSTFLQADKASTIASSNDPAFDFDDVEKYARQFQVAYPGV